MAEPLATSAARLIGKLLIPSVPSTLWLRELTGIHRGMLYFNSHTILPGNPFTNVV